MFNTFLYLLVLYFITINALIFSATAIAEDKADAKKEAQFQKHHENAKKYFKEGKYDETIEELQKAVEIKKEDPELHYELGSVYDRTGNYLEALKSYQKGTSLAKSPNYIVLKRIGFIQYKVGDFEKAAEAYEQCTKIMPDPDYQVYMNLGFSYYALKKYDDAIKNLEKSLELKPKNPHPYYYLAKSYEKLENYSEALKLYEKSLLYEPNSYFTLNAVSWLLSTCPDEKYRNGTQAVIYAERLNDFTKGQNSMYLDTLAAAYAESGKFEDAVKTQEKGLNYLIRSSADKSVIEEFKVRLSSYKNKKPWRSVFSGK